MAASSSDGPFAKEKKKYTDDDATGGTILLPTFLYLKRQRKRLFRNSLLKIFAPSFIVAYLSLRFFTRVSLFAARKIPEFGALGASNHVLQQGVPLLGLVFSIITNNTFQAMYDQQETTYLALFAEVSCAKALVEQLLLVLGGKEEPRARAALESVSRYVSDDLRKVDRSARRLSSPYDRFERRLLTKKATTFEDEARSFPDPLEALLYLSSVGDPSPHVYATVKELRGCRARRLGALQRKLPGLQFGLLYVLAAALMGSFVLTVAPCSVAARTGHALEATAFSMLAFALVACLRVLQDLWEPTSGAYSVSAVLATMVRGLEAQLDELLGRSPPEPRFSTTQTNTDILI